MNLIEIRNLVFNFMKQFTAQDLKLLMNFLEVSVTDYERDPIKYYGSYSTFTLSIIIKNALFYFN